MKSSAEVSVVQLGPYPPPHGGVQTNLVAIERYLRARGFECAAVNVTRHRRENTATVFYPHSATELLRLLLRLPHRIVHLHLGGDLPLRVVALALCCTLLPGKKSVLTLHSGGYPSSPAGRTARRSTLRGFVFRRFDRVIAVNAEIAGMFTRFGVASSHLRTIAPHAVEPLPVTGSLPEPIESFFAAHDPVLISMGQLEPEYDLPMQIDIVERIRPRHPRVGLLIAGSGSLDAMLRDYVASRAWGKHVFLAGDVAHEATLAALARARLMLRTTLYDGDAVSVREALAYGVPVIATDNGMRPPGVALIPKRNADALESAIIAELEIERGPRVAAACGEANIEAVLAVYRELVI
jgi:glycosyltransferase involved in cell wall biosynthesis